MRRTPICASCTTRRRMAIEDNLFGQAPHTDNSFMTALARTDVPGLAVRLPSGEWFAPPIIPGTFLINLGNIMRRWSNDRFLSTPHGVLNEVGDRPLFDRLFPQPQRRTARSNACRAASAPTIRRAIRRRSTAIWCSNSIGPIISTRRAIGPRQPRWPARSPIGGKRCSTSTSSSTIAAPRCARTATHKAAREVLARANSDPAAIVAALGEPTRAGVNAALQIGGADDPQRRLGQGA